MNFEIQENSKDQQWKAISLAVESIVDRLGRGIDEKIKPAVIALKANGFGTTESCEGHLDRGEPWPWIVVESPLAERLLSDSRYAELKEKARGFIKEGKEMAIEEKEEYHGLTSQQIEENEREYQRLLSLLESFYRKAGVNGSVRLVIDKGPWSQSHIQPEGTALRGQKGEIKKLSQEEEEARARNLELYRQEMSRFSEFLKELFFKTNP